MRDMSIKTVGKLAIASIVVLFSMYTVGSLMIDQQVKKIGKTWNSYVELRNPKMYSFEQFVQSFGYGGIVHNYHDLLLTKDLKLERELQHNVGRSLHALELYEQNPLVAEERKAIAVLRNIINDYSKSAMLAYDLIQKKHSAVEIDVITSIDRTGVFDAASLLKRHSLDKNSKSDRKTRAGILGEIAFQMGCGGFICSYKNYILSRGQYYADTAIRSLSSVNKLIEDYRGLDLREAELEALDKLKSTLQNYTKSLNRLLDDDIDLATLSPEETNRILSIDDGPALSGIKTLRQINAKILEQDVTNLVGEIANIHQLTSYATKISVIILPFGSLLVYLFLFRIIATPIEKITGYMSILADNNANVDLDDLKGDNEIGRMATSLAVFRENLLVRQRFGTIIENSLHEIYLIDADTFKFIDVNRGARINLGYSHEELQSLTPKDVLSEVSEKKFQQEVEPLLTGEVEYLCYETTLIRKDKTEYIVDVHLELDKSGDQQIFVALVNDVTSEKQAEKELLQAKENAEKLAYFDPLTGLANRAGCIKSVKKKFDKIDTDARLSVIHIDLDDFKRVNDTLGHDAGDKLLAEIGRRLKNSVGKYGSVYRWGGDEFIAIIEEKQKDEIAEICDEMNNKVSQSFFIHGREIWPTTCIGIANYRNDGRDFQSLLIHSDLALYKSKVKGPGNYTFFTKSMREVIVEEALLESELRTAIVEDQLSLVYQPQIDIDTNEVTGIEALLRWNHPTRGTISPLDFLAIAEKTPLACTIGRLVFDKAFETAKIWQKQGLSFGKMCVNLSPQHLKSGMLYDDFMAALEYRSLEPGAVVLEVLETVLLDDTQSLKTIERLHNEGVSIELDDFGTGYSSLSHILSMPIDGIKIDKSFTKELLKDNRKSAIVESLFELTNKLNLRLVCEGVETVQQLDYLRGVGGGSVQGYLAARPSNFRDSSKWLRSPTDLRKLTAIRRRDSRVSSDII